MEPSRIDAKSNLKLLSSGWNRVTGQLEVGDEVTIYGEKACEPVNFDSFWGIVTKSWTVIKKSTKSPTRMATITIHPVQNYVTVRGMA